MGLSVVYLLLGLFVSKGIETNEDYFLAGRKVGLWPLTFTLIATQIGGGMLLGSAQESYYFGYYGIFYTLGMSLGFLLLGCGFASKLRLFNVSTVAELFETKYKSVLLKKVASAVSAVSLCGLLAGQVVALKSLLWGLGIDNNLVFFAFWAFIIIYTMMGGLKAVIATDLAQVLFLLLVFTCIFLYSLSCEPASFFNFKNMFMAQRSFETGRSTFVKLFPVLISPMFFSLIEQDLGQRFFAAKTKKIAALAAIFSSIALLLFSFVPVYFGMKARLTGVDIAFGASPLIPVIGNMTNNFVLALVVCGLCAAITSTADSLLCAISSNIAQDFDFAFIKKRSKLSISKAVTFLIGLLALLVGYFAENIIEMLVQSYELLISCLFVPVFFCFFKKSFNKQSAAYSMAFGALGFIFFKFYPMEQLNFPNDIIVLSFSLLGYLIGPFLWAGRQIKEK